MLLLWLHAEMLLEKQVQQGNDLHIDWAISYPRGLPNPGAVEHFCFPVDVSTVGSPPGQYHRPRLCMPATLRPDWVESTAMPLHWP
eukprot:SAG25_NODE_46_length_19040_cov_20.665699_19_plen_86_part_00